MTSRGILVAVVWCVLIASAHAQTLCETTCTVRVGQPVVVFTEAVPEEVSGCRLWVNGAPTAVAGTFTNGYLEYAFPQGFARGVYTIFITCVVSAGSEEQYTETGTLTVQRGRVRFK